MTARALARIAVACATAAIFSHSGAPVLTAQSPAASVLRLATTTSTADTGLLAALLPDFQRQCKCRVDVIAVGTGQALELGRRGDVDVLLVHDREQEDAFLADGHASDRADVMYNDFVIVGPAGDPAGVGRARTAAEAFKSIARTGAIFASRGDKSGTHSKELGLWKLAGTPPPADAKWYMAVGQGMGETLTLANQRGAYTLSDRGTWLSMRSKLGALRLLLGGNTLQDNPDRHLRNDYRVLTVNPLKHPTVKVGLADEFMLWIQQKPTQEKIARFGVDAYGQSLFYPNSDEMRATSQLVVTVGEKTRTLTLEQLRALRAHVLENIEFVGVKRGKLGVHTWKGPLLKDVLLAVDPTLSNPTRRGSTVVLTSSDGWTTTVKWAELFGTVPEGERRYLAKGCNECHGSDGEGTAPAGKRPAPALARRTFDVSATAALVRDKARHAGIFAYTPENLSDREMATIIAWLENPAAAGKAPSAPAMPPSGVFLLAYERDRRSMTGRDGLIQFVAGGDEFASRFAHWVASIAVR